MYLNKKTYIGNEYRKPEQRVKIIVPNNQKGVIFPTKVIKEERITEIVERVGYWRKANAIHKWFVDNIQNGNDDCKEYYVTTENLQNLLDTVNKVLNASKLVKGEIQNGYNFDENGKKIPIMVKGRYIKDPSVAQELLPTTEGCFFGSTGYDEYYIADLELTKKICEEAIAEGGEFSYSSSW